jgi:RNA polymerase sigma factor (sigma-70 family)
MSLLGTEEEVKELTQHLLRYFLSRRTSSLDDAWDLVQETLLRVLQTASKEKLESTEGYSIGVAKKVTFEYYRKRVKDNKHDSINYDSNATILKDNYNSPEQQIIYKDLGCKLHYGMSRLPTNMRDLLVERFIKEVPAKTVAVRNDVSVKTIDMRVYRAKNELRKCVA